MSEKQNKLPKIEYVLVTPDQARQWLDERMFERQRTVRAGTVKNYTRAMTEGKWRPWTVLQFTESGNGNSIGTDGQHRLLAVEASGIPMQAIVVTYPGTSMADVVDQYTKTDKGRPRSAMDTIVAMNLAEKYNTSNSLINKAWAAVQMIVQKFENVREARLESDALRMLEDEGYIQIAKTYSDLVGSMNYQKGFYRRSTMSIGLYTLKYASAFIEEAQIHSFWKNAAEGVGSNPHDPVLMLHKHCTSHQMYVNTKTTGKHESVSVAFSTRFTAKCWNNYLNENEPVIRFQVSTKDKLVIEATPLGKEIKVGSK